MTSQDRLWFPYALQFGLGQKFVSIERVRHGWARTHHFETRPTRNLSLLEQTHYYAPDENGGLSQWADHTLKVTYSLKPFERSPRNPHGLFLSLYIIFLFLWFYVFNMYLFSNSASLSPAFISSIPRASHVSP